MLKPADLEVELAKRLPLEWDDHDFPTVFDPWVLWPAIYGSYSKEFGDAALHVLRNLVAGRPQDEAIAHEMLREMLCVSGVCDYGTSPRVCFVNPEFRPLIEKWLTMMEREQFVRWNDAETR